MTGTPTRNRVRATIKGPATTFRVQPERTDAEIAPGSSNRGGQITVTNGQRKWQ